MMLRLKLITFFYLFIQALADSDLYAPFQASCSSNTQLLRQAKGLSSSETQWLKASDVKTKASLKRFFKYSTKLSEEEYEMLLLNDTMRIGVAVSGGSYRSMLVGAGEIAALDNRTLNAFSHGLGGILQSTTYLAGTSGGSWVVASLTMNSWRSVQDIISNRYKIWDLAYPVYDLGGLNPFKLFKVYKALISEIKSKHNAGFRVSMTDIWGAAISRQFFPSSAQYGINLTWSGLQNSQVFQSGEMPMPIAVANVIKNDSQLPYSQSTVIEMTPFEFGSWDKSVNAFAQTKYIGTNVTNGKVVNGVCTTHFDNVGFIIGTSSSIFVNMLNYLKAKSKTLVLVSSMFEKVFAKISNKNLEQAIYEPSPFYQNEYGKDSNIINDQKLLLVDGGSDGQNIPLLPLIAPSRKVDTIFAFDNSEGLSYYPNGSSIISTYQRQFTGAGKSMAFPKVPSTVAAFMKQNLHKKTTFFGCDAGELKNLTYIPPIIIYTPNHKMSIQSNVSTYDLKFSDSERNSLIKNGFELASANNRTDDTDWNTCVGCALVRRSQERFGIEQSETCQQCFAKYCWKENVV